MTPESTDLSLAHLQAELARLDVRIQREVRRWQLAGQDPIDTLRGLKVTDQDVQGLLARPFGGNRGQTVDLAEEAEGLATAEAEAKAGRLSQSLVQTTAKHGYGVRPNHLAEVCGLDRLRAGRFFDLPGAGARLAL